MSYYDSPLKDNVALKYIEETLGYPIESLLLFPRFFLIENINICNARCIMCGIDFDRKKKAVIDDGLFEKISEEIGRYSGYVEKVMIYLDGEPLLDKKLADKITRMKKANVKTINIATNASLLDEKRSRELIEAGLDEIYITIDSLKKDIFEKMRVGLKFKDVYENTLGFIRIRDSIKCPLAVRIQMILNELNKDEADDFLKHWKPLLSAQDQVVVQKPHNWGSTIDVLKFGGEDKVNNIPCIALWGTMSIHLNGIVGLCCMDYNNTVVIGDLNKQSIEQIWRADALSHIRKMHISGQRHKIAICNGCTLWREARQNRKEAMSII